MSLKRTGAAPTVVLVGRPNVGKSTLFNRVTGSRRVIVTPQAGTTRDTIAQTAEWQGIPFSLVDTGGMFGVSTDPLHELVVEHGRKAIASADVLVFIVDGREGLVPAAAPSSSIDSGSIRSSRWPPSTAWGWGICWMRS
jgi:GTP-binding protein